MQELQERSSTPPEAKSRTATVAKVIDDSQVVLNKGAVDGISFGQRFTLYEVSEQDIVDPATNESLGRLETNKGTGSIVHIQDRLSVLEATTLTLINLFGPSKSQRSKVRRSVTKRVPFN